MLFEYFKRIFSFKSCKKTDDNIPDLSRLSTEFWSSLLLRSLLDQLRDKIIQWIHPWEGFESRNKGNKCYGCRWLLLMQQDLLVAPGKLWNMDPTWNIRNIRVESRVSFLQESLCVNQDLPQASLKDPVDPFLFSFSSASSFPKAAQGRGDRRRSHGEIPVWADKGQRGRGVEERHHGALPVCQIRN